MDQRRSTLRFIAGRLGAYLAAVVVAYVLATLTATQAVVSRLEAMGVAVPAPERLAMSVRDLAGMAGMFLPMIAFALLVGFLSAALLCHRLRRYLWPWRPLVYAAAGAVALVTIHVTLNLAFGLHPVAIARTWGGLLLQALAGAAGGVTYLSLARRGTRVHEPRAMG
ncbi:MAG: hypothetical protein ACSLE2_02685 [Lysobacterales bacterium]